MMNAHMKSRTFEFRTHGVRGLPAALLIALGVVGIVAVVALLLFVGVAVAAAALVISAGLALWHGVRRKLGVPEPRPPVASYDARPFFEDAPPAAMPPSPSSTLTEAREIEVEVLPKQER